MPELILASSSPRRKKLLSEWGYGFTSISPGIDESIGNPGPRKLAETLSEMKAAAVGKRSPQDSVIVASDLVVGLAGRVFGKPRNPADAARMLRELSGRTHKTFCGVTVLENSTGRKLTGVSVAEVTLRKLSDGEIAEYVATGEPADKAGAYAIQGKGRRLVARIRGERSGIVGLAKSLVIGPLRRFGVRPRSRPRVRPRKNSSLNHSIE